MSKKLEIYACSGVGNVSKAQRVAQDIEDSGWMRNETLRKYLGTSKDGGCAEYFLYMFIPESELGKYNSIIYKKRKQQIKTFEYVRELFVSHNYGTEDDMLQIIRDGIEATFGVNVEQVLMEIRTGKREIIGVVLTASAIAAIVSAVASVLIAVISGVIQYCMSVKVAQYTAPTYQELADSTPADTDFLDTSKKKGWIAAAIAGGVLLLGIAIKRFRN